MSTSRRRQDAEDMTRIMRYLDTHTPEEIVAECELLLRVAGEWSVIMLRLLRIAAGKEVPTTPPLDPPAAAD